MRIKNIWILGVKLEPNDAWAGVDFKLGSAEFFLEEMGKDLIHPRHRPESRSWAAVQESTGAIVSHQWQRRFYYHLDGFLAAARSVPDTIQWNFGTDNGWLKDWMQSLPGDELQRREKFQQQFKVLYRNFSDLPLSQARVATIHRTGLPPVTVQINGRWGVYLGDPVSSVPAVESPFIEAGDDPALQWAATQPGLPVEPSWKDFTLVLPQPGGTEFRKPLFEACREYLEEVRRLADKARQLYQQEHHGQPVSLPPLFD